MPKMPKPPMEEEDETIVEEEEEQTEEPGEEMEAEAPESDDMMEQEMGVKSAAPLSPDEERSAKQALTAISKLLYKNPKVGKAVVELIRKPPHFTGISDATMLLITHVKEQGISIPDHMIAGIALKTMELVMDLGLSLGFLPQDERLVQMSVEKTLRAVADSYGVDPGVLHGAQKQLSPGQGLLE